MTSRARPLPSWRGHPWMLLALPLVACVVPSFDLQPGAGSDDGPAGGGGSDGSGASATDGAGGSSGAGGSDASGGGTAAGDGGTGGSSGGTGGSSGGSASGGVGGPDLDENGKENAAPGDVLTTSGDYLRLGEIRLVNDSAGSMALGCTPPDNDFSVFVNSDSTFGWAFERADCDGAIDKQFSDFPHLEFGIHPFGDALDTALDFSSTSLLPIQMDDIVSFSLDLGLGTSLQAASSWTTELRIWLSERNPATDPAPGVYAQIDAYFGWDGSQWPSAPGADGSDSVGLPDTVASDYTLWARDDSLDRGYRYLQFRWNDGPGPTFHGTVLIKGFTSYVVSEQGYPADLWVSQIQVGSKIDDETSGTVSIDNCTFELNGAERSPDFK